MLRAPLVCLAILTVSVEAAALTVEEAVSAGCSTSQVAGLSLQIIEQGNCIEPGAYVELPARPNVSFGSAVLPYLEQPARDALLAALDTHPSTAMQVNSMLRTVAQQYLLYRWYLLGDCGIGLAATPGNSNHETGLAIDIQQYAAWRDILARHDFEWYGSGDPVHFDYVGPGAVDHRGVDVLAFQELWNRNHADDLIAEDGVYGPETEGRLKQAPAEGFALGAECAPPPMEGVVVLDARFTDADDSFDDGPSAGVFDLWLGESYAIAVELRNETVAEADGTVAVVLPGALAGDTTIDLGLVPPGETAQGVLEVRAESYSVDDLEPLRIVLSAGDAAAELEADVYSTRRWEWNGGRLEGWQGMVAVTDSTLAIDGPAQSPPLALPAGSLSAVDLRLATTVPAALVFAVAGETRRHELAVPADGVMHELSLDSASLGLPAGEIATLSLETGGAELDYLRLQTADGSLPEQSGCACRLAPTRAPDRFAWLLALLSISRRRRT